MDDHCVCVVVCNPAGWRRPGGLTRPGLLPLRERSKMRQCEHKWMLSTDGARPDLCVHRRGILPKRPVCRGDADSYSERCEHRDTDGDDPCYPYAYRYSDGDGD